MDLWIRSQNKTELMKVVDLDIYDAGEPKTYVIESRGIILGNYKTQQRALEVLDEIQNKIAQNQSLISLMNNFTDLKGNEEGISKLFKDMIYEMPKE